MKNGETTRKMKIKERETEKQNDDHERWKSALFEEIEKQFLDEKVKSFHKHEEKRNHFRGALIAVSRTAQPHFTSQVYQNSLDHPFNGIGIRSIAQCILLRGNTYDVEKRVHEKNSVR